MTSREKKAVKQFRRLSLENQDQAVAIIQAVRVAEKTTQKVFYERFGIPPGWDLGKTAVGENCE